MTPWRFWQSLAPATRFWLGYWAVILALVAWGAS